MNENEKELKTEGSEEFRVEEKSTKKNYTPLIIILGVVIVCVVAVMAYYFIWNNPKNIFLNAVNSEYQTLSNKLSNLSDTNKISTTEDVVASKSTLDFDVKASSQLQDPQVTKLLSELSKLNLTVNSGVHRKNKEFAAELLLNSEKDELLNVGVYGTKKSIYVELKNLLNKFIEIPMEEEYDSLFNNSKVSIDDVDYIMNATKDSFLKNLDKKDFKQAKETIKIDKKDVKVTKTSYKLNDKTAKILVENMVKDLKKDKKFVEKLAAISGQKESEVKKDMDDTIKEIAENTSSNEDVITLSIYTKGMMNEAMAYEFNQKNKYTENNIRYTKGKISTIVYTEDGDEQFHLTMQDETSNKSKLTFIANTVTLTINTEKKDDVHKYVYTLSEKESDMKIYGTVTANMKEVAKNKEYQQSMDIEMFMDISGITKALTFKANTEGTTEVGKEIKIPEIKNVTPVESLSEEDMATILTNLSKNPKLMEFVNTINSLF